MTACQDLGAYRVVRLNARISPVSQDETSLYARYGLRPLEVEANSPAELSTVLAGCDGLFVVSSALPAEVIATLDRCRVISRLGIGTDKIDLEAATRQGIVVTNVPGCFSEEMADHTLAFLLGLARKLPQMSAAMQRGDWSGARRQSVHNQRLSQATLGLVGFGDSARLVAQRARAFGLRILATRRRMDQPDPIAQALGVELVDLDTLLAESDYVSLHLPLNAATRHLLDEATLRKMKPGACLINTARGALVDEAALARLLAEGYLGGAGLDTFENIDVFIGQDGRQESPLLHLDNVLLSPHVSALSEEGMRQVTAGGIENLAAALSGKWPLQERVVNRGVIPRQKLE